MRKIEKPQEGEYAPYAIMYISLLPEDGLVLTHLTENLQTVKDLVLSLPEQKLDQPHALGEWTVKEILVHIIDTERIFAYRALRFARNDMTDLPGFEQNEYVPYSGANQRSIDDILEEYSAVRAASITLLSSLSEEADRRVGTTNGNPTSVRALAYQIAGHELHHLNSIRENYLAQDLEQTHTTPAPNLGSTSSTLAHSS